MKIDCEITSESSRVVNENMKYFQNLKEIDLNSKNEIKIDNHQFGDEGCKVIFFNAKYLSNLEELYLRSNQK